jgi:hypothetical protein
MGYTSAVVEVDFEEQRARLGQCGYWVVGHKLNAAQLHAPEKGTICSEGEDTLIRDLFATAEIDALQSSRHRCETDDGSIRCVNDAGEIDGDKIWAEREYARESLIWDESAIDEGQPFEPIALGEASKEGVREVDAQVQEVESADETSIGERLIAAAENAHHFDESGQRAERWFVP